MKTASTKNESFIDINNKWHSCPEYLLKDPYLHFLSLAVGTSFSQIGMPG